MTKKLAVAASILFSVASYSASVSELYTFELNQGSACLSFQENMNEPVLYVDEGQDIRQTCLDLGYDAYHDINDTYYTLRVTNVKGLQYLKDLQWGDFHDDYPGLGFDDITPEIINSYMGGGKKGSSKKTKFFRLQYGDFGLFKVETSEDVFTGKIRVNDDNSLTFFSVGTNDAPVVSAFDIKPLLVDEATDMTWDELTTYAQMSDPNGDEIVSIFIEPTIDTLSIQVNGFEITTLTEVTPQDMVTFTSSVVGLAESFNVYAFDGTDMSENPFPVAVNTFSQADINTYETLVKTEDKVAEFTTKLNEAIASGDEKKINAMSHLIEQLQAKEERTKLKLGLDYL